MLDFQTFQASFRFGVEEGTDPKQVPFGTLTVAKNVVWLKSGRLEKRQGTTRLSTTIVSGGNLSAAKRLITRGSELCVIDGTYLYSRSDDGWINRGRVADVGIEWSVAQDSMQGVKSFDTAVLSNGNIVEAWVAGDPTQFHTTNNDIWYRIIDPDTGTVVTAPTQLVLSANGYFIRLIVSGNNWGLLWTDGGNLKIYTSHAGTTTTLKNNAIYAFDARAISSGSEFIVAYALSPTGITLVRYSFVSVPVQQATATVAGEAQAVDSISIDGIANDILWIGYSKNTGGAVKFATANSSTLAQIVAPVTVEAPAAGITTSNVGIVRTGATTCLLLYSHEGGGETGGVTRSVQITSAGVISTDRKSYFLRLLTRPFAVGSRYYAVASNYSLASVFTSGNAITGSETFLIDATYDTNGAVFVQPARCVGKIEMLTGGTWGSGYTAGSAAMSSTRVFAPSPFQSSEASNKYSWRQGVHRVEVTSGSDMPEDMWRSVEQSGEAYLCAGTLLAYDGVEVVGYGWPYAPCLQSVTAAVSTGVIVAGTYLYAVTAERRSAVGLLHRSPVSATVSVTIGGGGTNTGIVRITPVSLAYSANNFGIYPIYRTTVGGSVVQRLTVEPLNAVVVNTNFGSQPATKNDTAADANVGGVALSDRPTLYTEGGELEDFQPTSVVTACIYRNRIFAIAGDRRTVVFSKSFADNQGTAGGFNAAFRLLFPETLTALSVLDERLIVFAEKGIYTLAGDGPAPNGDESDYGAPNKLQTDVGCTNARGVVEGPEGVFFVSNGDIHMLDRGMSVVWVGKPVQDLLSSYPNVTSAVLISKKNQVRFSAQNSGGTSSIVLVYDYSEKQWSHFVYGENISGGGGVGLAIADACLYSGAYTFVTTAGQVYQESESTNLDDGSWVTASIETAWIHANGPLGYYSVRNFRLDGESVSAHILNISVGFDGNTTYQQGPTVFAESTTGVTSVGPMTAGVSIGNRRKSRAVRFKIEDAAPVTLGTGKGGKWSTMALEVGNKGGVCRLPATQRG